MKAVILAAGVGSRLAPLTDDRPKALVEVAGRTLLHRQLDALATAGIPARDTVVVGGYRIDALHNALARSGHGDVAVVVNEMYAPWNNFWSLAVAEPAVRGCGIVQLDGDTVLDGVLLPRLLAAPGEAVLAVDVRPELDDETMKVQLDGARVIGLHKQLPAATCAGEYIGISRLSAAAAARVFEELVRLRDEGLTGEYYESAYLRLMQRRELDFGIVDVHDCAVLEIDDRHDLAAAEALLTARDR